MRKPLLLRITTLARILSASTVSRSWRESFNWYGLKISLINQTITCSSTSCSCRRCNASYSCPLRIFLRKIKIAMNSATSSTSWQGANSEYSLNMQLSSARMMISSRLPRIHTISHKFGEESIKKGKYFIESIKRMKIAMSVFNVVSSDFLSKLSCLSLRN